MILIPSFSDPFYDQTTTLDGKQYQFFFFYSQREDRWYFNLRDVDQDVAVVSGVKCEPGTDLLLRTKYLPNCPQGQLLVYTGVGLSDDAPGLLELGLTNRATLVYIPLDEVPA